jgi:membrane-associated phospholipid phosphatase
MDRSEKRAKRCWFLFMIGYFTAGYLAINWFSQTRSSYFNPSFAFERHLPFMPEFIFGYVLVYLSVLLIYFVINDMGDWHRGVIAFLTATTLAYIIFLLFPVRMELRPEIGQVSGTSFAAALTRWYYYIDAPYNLFPSLHVTYPTIAMLIAWKRHPLMRLVLMVMMLIVAVSVVLVKQHYVADVIAGFLNATLCYIFAVRAERWLQARRKASAIKPLDEGLDASGSNMCNCV